MSLKEGKVYCLEVSHNLYITLVKGVSKKGGLLGNIEISNI